MELKPQDTRRCRSGGPPRREVGRRAPPDPCVACAIMGRAASAAVEVTWLRHWATLRGAPRRHPSRLHRVDSTAHRGWAGGFVVGDIVAVGGRCASCRWSGA